MNILLVFQWHKLLHFILPIIIILIFHKNFEMIKICIVVFIAGLTKEVFDIIAINDPIWLSAIDTIFNIVGIILGIVLSNTHKFSTL